MIEAPVLADRSVEAGASGHEMISQPDQAGGRSSLILARTASGSVNHCALSGVYSSHSPGTAESWKIAVTGHSGSQAPHSMHSSGLMYSIRSAASSPM